MKKATNLIVSVIAASLILVTGCYDNAMDGESVPGYDGTVANGWTAFDAGDYEGAIECFLAAIDMDVSQPDAYLGAGWCSILLPEYWVLGDQYDYMAVQLDNGTWPIQTVSTSVVQDLNWTEFQCIDPVLTANDMLVIGSFGDTILVVEGDTLFWGGTMGPDSTKGMLDNYEIGEWLYDQYGAVNFKYTHEIADPNVQVLYSIANGYSLVDCMVDSIVNNASSSTVYIEVVYDRTPVGDDDYRTWCMYENTMSYTYTTYDAAAGSTDMANNGVAAYAVLQHARGSNGDVQAGVASLLGLADEAEYSFSHWTSLTSLKLKGMAAAVAYLNTEFRFAFAICRSEGFAMGIELTDDNFVLELGQQIEMMISGS